MTKYPELSTSGFISLESYRLPIKQINIEDTGSGIINLKNVKFSIGKLECLKEYSIEEDDLEDISNCEDRFNFDAGKLAKCVTMNFRYLIYFIKHISFVKIYKYLDRTSNCTEMSIFSKILNDKPIECKEKSLCLFECYSSELNIYNLKLKETNETCEIKHIFWSYWSFIFLYFSNGLQE